MKITTRMPARLLQYYRLELQQASVLLKNNNFPGCWHHLERAHIIGQPYPLQHTYVHWRMISFACIVKDWHEIVGQLPRLLVGGVKSFVGEIPVGNTGGSNVPPLQPMEIPDDLQRIIASKG